ncbi:hypothetical protein EIP86_001128 [Pleurotus ostreatoroseus]|nr:hypothetical protein EIP86_001128 [Pleurotus ostreatoroseus]
MSIVHFNPTYNVHQPITVNGGFGGQQNTVNSVQSLVRNDFTKHISPSKTAHTYHIHKPSTVDLHDGLVYARRRSTVEGIDNNLAYILESEWYRTAQQRGFTRVDLRGKDDFDELETFVQAMPTVSRNVRTLIFFDQAENGQPTINVDTLIDIIKLLPNLRDLELKNLKLQCRVGFGHLPVSLSKTETLSLRNVLLEDLRAVVDVLGYLPNLRELQLRDVEEGLIEGPLCDQARRFDADVWDLDFINTIFPNSAPKNLTNLRLESVCNSHFYLNLVRAAFEGDSTKLVQVSVACRDMNAILGLGDLLACSPSIQYLKIDMKMAFIYGVNTLSDNLALYCVNVTKCQNLKSLTFSTHLSLHPSGKNELAWNSMCAFLASINSQRFANADIHLEIGQGNAMGEILTPEDVLFSPPQCPANWPGLNEALQHLLSAALQDIELHFDIGLKWYRTFIRNALPSIPRELLHLHGANDAPDGSTEAESDEEYDGTPSMLCSCRTNTDFDLRLRRKTDLTRQYTPIFFIAPEPAV